ncbi:MAG: RDD family protein [Defluviitaleaceae bacterium]|nr:RDD family protein [Defluviitaleaceae bacterium]
MKIHTVLTPANIEIEYRLAGAGSRLAAFVIDFTIQILACILIAVIILFGIYGYNWDTLGNIEGFALGFLIISWFVIYFCYFIVLEMLLNGQSIGKKIFGLRVIRDNGQPVGLSQSLVRNLFRAVLDILYVGIFVILFSKDHKRVGDMVAGTVVIAEHYDDSLVPARSDALPAANPVAMEKMQHLILTPEELELLNSYMARKVSLPDDGAALQREWAAYFAQKWDIHLAPEQINNSVLSGILQLNEAKY